MLMQQRIWKKFWPLEDTVMGLQEEMFFSKFQQACHTRLCSRPQHTSLQEQIHAVDCGFQFSMCVGQRPLQKGSPPYRGGVVCVSQ